MSISLLSLEHLQKNHPKEDAPNTKSTFGSLKSFDTAIAAELKARDERRRVHAEHEANWNLHLVEEIEVFHKMRWTQNTPNRAVVYWYLKWIRVDDTQFFNVD
eukprot:scaffold119_cov79-Skeletonema_dohrnii-CCMP3373.AAC.10